jgi:hypothetical protein
MNKILASITLCLSSGCLSSQFNFDSLLTKTPVLKKIWDQARKYHLQIIYTQIDYKNETPVFTDHLYRVNPENYFYCASLVKLPVSIVALQKLNELGLKRNCIMYTDSSRACHRTINRDTSSENKYPSIEHYIKKMLLVSDNSAYSRVFEFIGVDYLHKNLAEKGYPDIRILSRYDGDCAGKDGFVSNPIAFLDSNLKVIFQQKEQITLSMYSLPVKNTLVGKAYYDSNNKRVNAPKNFSGSNYLNLKDCHSLLKDLIYASEYKFAITQEQRLFLINHLSRYPRQSVSPKYNSKIYYDSYKKYLFYGDSKANIEDTNIIITNIVGQSYGFMSDCAHFSDKKNKVEFMLSAVIYANEDEVLSDGKYDYKTVALPFLAELGRQFYKYELLRIKK